MVGEEAFFSHIGPQRLKQELASAADAAADGDDLRVQQVNHGDTGRAQMIHIGIKDGLGGLVAFLGTVNDEFGVDDLSVTAGLLGQRAFGVSLHGTDAVTGQGCGGAVGFDTAVQAAGAVLAAVHQRHMAKLDALTLAAGEHLTAQDQSAADAGAQRQKNGGLVTGECASAKLGQTGTIGVIGQINSGFFKLCLKLRLKRHIVEAQVIGIEYDRAGGINAAGNDDANPVQVRFSAALLRQELADFCGDLLGNAFTIHMREGDGAAANDIQVLVNKTDFDIGTADIDTDLVHGDHFLVGFSNFHYPSKPFRCQEKCVGTVGIF